MDGRKIQLKRVLEAQSRQYALTLYTLLQRPLLLHLALYAGNKKEQVDRQDKQGHEPMCFTCFFHVQFSSLPLTCAMIEPDADNKSDDQPADAAADHACPETGIA
jgi:hypothetical protein